MDGCPGIGHDGLLLQTWTEGINTHHKCDQALSRLRVALGHPLKRLHVRYVNDSMSGEHHELIYSTTLAL